jgi:hypothetical protein
MQTLSPTISRITDSTDDELPAIAKSSLLQAALNGLDANLNDELERYRHWQSNGQSFSYLNPFRPSGKSSAWSPVRAEGWVEDNYAGNATLPTIPMHPNRVPVADAIHTIKEIQSPRNRKVIEEPLHPFPTAEVSQTADPAYSQGYGSANFSVNAANVTANTSARAVDNAEFLRNISNGYQEEDEFVELPLTAKPSDTNIFSGLMNPVGAISLMLLLVSSALIGFLIVDPSGLVKLLKNEQKSSALSDPNSDVSISSQNRQPSLLTPNSQDKNSVPFVPLPGTQPGQTKQGFTSTTPGATPSTNAKTTPTTSLRSLPTSGLSTNLPPVSYDTPKALRPIESYSEPYTAPSPASTPSSTRSNAQTRPSVQTRPTTSVAAKTAPTSAPVLPYIPSTTPQVKYSAPISSVTPAANNNGGNHRVVVDGNYATQVQQVHKDAFVRSDGQAQVGAYQDINTARQRANELRRQGIPARVN